MTITIIYVLVARGTDTILSTYSPYAGNFSALTIDVLKERQPQYKFYQQNGLKERFYSIMRDGFIFMALVDHKYDKMMSFSLLRQAESRFFQMYSEQVRNQVKAHKLRNFNPILQMLMKQYQSPNEDTKGKAKGLFSKDELSELIGVKEGPQLKQQIFALDPKSKYISNIKQSIQNSNQEDDDTSGSGCTCRPCSLM